MAAPKDRAEKGERGLLRGIFSVSMGIQGSHFVSFSAPEGGLCRQWWMCVTTGDDLWVGEPDRALRLLPGLWALYLQDSTHGTGQDLVHGDPRSTSLQEAQVPHDSSRAQDALRGGAGPSGSRDEAYRAWSLQRHRLEKLVAKLVPAVLGGHPSYVNTFLGSYRTFATAQQVLDHLFRRYGCILPFTEEDGGPLHQLKQAMASILGTWLLQFPDDFHQPPEFPCLKTIVTYIELSMAGSDLEQQAHLLLTQLEQLELPEADSDAPAPEPAGETPLHGEPAPALLPATAPEPESDTEPEQRDVLSCEAAASSLLSAVDPGPSSGPPSTLPETPPLV
ncbi:ral guanine nucleotide dissociation stimulator-like isoform X2 [Camelus ferus]|nr:ral guanine nucleotide dissociation stimulator-like isoform X2 [Camelus ferus]XP_032347611.1 ral guanine nucleotide dissociation stimulator-like isoform X2 [Camelus ferus]XP_032347614.1 ral guanine nucleotide dissociation stimulator-like isoform X2 [Camelus ferus]